ncbi:MAG: Vancomycin/teicoplanin A-type resistance protein VanA [Firmicutes bacterium]|nr:Vancomycin/teicoplanin A-type resistance protein VanA [Bacillota bacterium]
MRLRVAVVYTAAESNHHNCTANPHGAEQLNKTNIALKQTIEELGYEVHMIPGDFDLLRALGQTNPDVVFNNCTGINDKSSQPQIAGMLELSKFPFTGSGQTAHVLALYKPLTKKVLLFHNVSTPGFGVVSKIGEPMPTNISFPVIVKPEHEGSSIGISAKSVANSPQELKEVVEEVITNFRQPALIEEFISGREFTVGVLGGEQPRILPPVEILFNEGSGFYSQAIKSQDGAQTKCPADILPELRKRIEATVLGAFKALECRDYARIDVRLDANGIPYVIDVNTLPGLEPGYSDYPKAAKAAGIEFKELVKHLLHSALARK